MGLEYTLKCFDCNKISLYYEYSIVGYIESKHPDECEEQVKYWTEFILIHGGHKLGLIDSKGNLSDPRRIRGDYVIGLKDFDQSLVQHSITNVRKNEV